MMRADEIVLIGAIALFLFAVSMIIIQLVFYKEDMGDV